MSAIKSQTLSGRVNEMVDCSSPVAMTFLSLALVLGPDACRRFKSMRKIASRGIRAVLIVSCRLDDGTEQFLIGDVLLSSSRVPGTARSPVCML